MQQRFSLQILLLAQHVSGTTMPIIRRSRVLYSGCCLWYFVLWFSSCWSGVELRVMCPVCRMLQHPATLSNRNFLFPILQIFNKLVSFSSAAVSDDIINGFITLSLLVRIYFIQDCFM